MRTALFIAMGLVASAGSISSSAAAQKAAKLDSIVTIGTRTTDRTATKSMVPVDVVTSASLQATGLPETWQALQRIIPSINVPRVPLNDDNLRPITLRGLSPDHVLVLIDGKRRHQTAVLQISSPVVNGSSAVDLNAIPSSAIDRIEVLRDGAAAQYGSDAIAGVINIVLKSGQASEGSLSAGRVQSSEGGRTFHDGEFINAAGAYGIQSRRGAALLVSAEFRDRGPTNRAYPDLRPQYFTGDPRNSNPHSITGVEGEAGATNVSVLLNASLPFGRIELYGLANAMERNSLSPYLVFRTPSDDRTVRSLHPDGFLSKLANDVLDYSAIAGVRGTTRSWRWDLGSVLGGNSVRYDLHNSNNVTLGNESPTDFYAGRLHLSQWTTNFDVSRSLMVANRLPLDVALGAEVRRDRYEVGAGDSASYIDGGVPILDGESAGRAAPVGAQGFFGFRPLDAVVAHRNNVAAYVEVESRVRKSLLASVAGRVERYSDYGSTSDGKIAARYTPVRGFSLRAATGSGFRAPSLAQSFFSTTRSLRQVANGVVNTVIARTVPVGSAEGRILGARPLKPESSVNLSAGFVIDVPRYPVVTVDYYAISIDDRIVQTSEFSDTSIARIFSENGQRGIVAAKFSANAVDTRTRGLDVVSTYGFSPTRSSLLHLSAGFNANRTRVAHIAQAPPQISRLQAQLFGRFERGKMEAGQPRNTITTTIDYSVKRLGMNLHNQRFGQTALLDDVSPAKDQTLRAKWITDFGVKYSLRAHLSAAVNVNNVFDVYPDEFWDFKQGVKAQGLSVFGMYRYPGGISPFGMNGRTVSLHLSYK